MQNVTILRRAGAPAAATEPRHRPPSGTGLFAALVAEFRRALVAERRYEDLAFSGPERLRSGIAPGEVARRTFEEVYAEPIETAREQAAPQPEDRRAAA